MNRSWEGRALSWSVADEILEVRLHREPANEIGTLLLEELERLADVVRRPPARALVWTSSASRGFCAGADLRELQAGLVERNERRRKILEPFTRRLPPAAADLATRGARRIAAPLIRRQIGRFIERIHDTFDALDQAPLTTIAAISGVCLGGGFELALTADILIADKSARFGFPELRLGLIPGFGGIPRLSRDAGNAVARDLLLTGRTIRASRAMELGIVSQLVTEGQAPAVARAVAKQATRLDPATTAEAKAFVKPLPKADLEREKETFLRMVTDPRVLRALTHFVEDRGPMPWLPKEAP